MRAAGRALHLVAARVDCRASCALACWFPLDSLCEVNQRTREIGIRMALGAQTSDVLRLVLREGALLIGAGLVLGWGGAVAVTRLIEGFLSGVRPNDPATFIVVAGLLTVVALLACWLPARRATKVDPMIALRCE